MLKARGSRRWISRASGPASVEGLAGEERREEALEKALSLIDASTPLQEQVRQGRPVNPGDTPILAGQTESAALLSIAGAEELIVALEAQAAERERERTQETAKLRELEARQHAIAERRLRDEIGEGSFGLGVLVGFRKLHGLVETLQRFVDAAGKTYGEMTGSGEPYLALRDPERFPGELPSGIAGMAAVWSSKPARAPITSTNDANTAMPSISSISALIRTL